MGLLFVKNSSKVIKLPAMIAPCFLKSPVDKAAKRFAWFTAPLVTTAVQGKLRFG
jgi:hypothetical protein